MGGEGVLVHCASGISRSVSACCAFLMVHRGMSLKAALTAVRVGRPLACPNEGFLKALSFVEEAHGDLVVAHGLWQSACAPSMEERASKLRKLADALHAEVDTVENDMANANTTREEVTKFSKCLEQLELRLDNAMPMDGDDSQAKIVRRAAMAKVQRLQGKLESGRVVIETGS